MEKTVERHVEIAWAQYNVIISTEPVWMDVTVATKV